MTHEYLLWISLFAYAIHIYEETVLDWISWVNKTSSLNLDWTNFFVANACVIIGGVAAAQVGWQFPAFGLLLPALQLINGLFFHLIPTILWRKLSPGVITSCVLFFPIGVLAFWGAWQDGVLTLGTVLLSLLFAIILLAIPFVFLKIQVFRKNKGTV